jgi:hypothetical protein
MIDRCVRLCNILRFQIQRKHISDSVHVTYNAIRVVIIKLTPEILNIIVHDKCKIAIKVTSRGVRNRRSSPPPPFLLLDNQATL